MIISNSSMYRNMQQQMEENDNIKEDGVKKDTEESKDHKEKDVETTNVSSDSMMTIAKMISSMLESKNQSIEISCIYDKLHELDKRIAICEKIIDYYMKSK